MKINDYILAFETSCDDTSVAVIDTNYNVLANIVSSQKDHEAYGGVVPELASRLHIKNIFYLTKVALKACSVGLDDISAIAVSVNPGLIGSLLVGVSFAKGLAFSRNLPLIPVNHMIGHIYANKIENPDLKSPFLALVVSGGHTELVDFKADGSFNIIGKTRDDAAGEAFDKIAKLMKLGYPGGPVIDKIAKNGNPEFFRFPRAMNQADNFDFSFSGLKTAIMNYLNKQTDDYILQHKADIVASAQAAIVDSLVGKTIRYAKANRINKVLLCGGVSANSELRKQFEKEVQKINCSLIMPPLKYCMDNAAMVGAAAVDKFKKKEFASLDLNAFSTKGIRFL